MSKKLNILLVFVVAMAMVLASCAPQTVVETVEVEKEVVTTVEVEKEVVTTVEVEKVVEVTAVPEEPMGDKTLIVWWSHWANEPAKVAVINQIAADYEEANPDVDIVVTWWDKNPLRDAVRSTMTAGEGAPDITTFDTEMREWADAGWLVDLEDTLPWENFKASAKDDGVYAGLEGNYKYNIGATVNMLLYNKDIFEELGIEVPEDFQFDQEEYREVVQKCADAGYAGVANAIGNRPHTGRRVIEDMMIPLVGAEQFGKWVRGDESVDTPEYRQVLQYASELAEIGLFPDTYATMTIDEYHVYFHTLRQACMLFNPTWYSGRAFQPVESGGQDPEWHFGMLRPPALDGAQFPNEVFAGYESGYAILSQTNHEEIAKDILKFASQPKYGALWVAVTNSPSAIIFDQAADWPSDETMEALGTTPGMWDWYWEEFDMVYGDADLGVAPIGWNCGEWGDAWVQAINEGIPQGLLTVDEAIELLNANMCQ
jgi:ABC-type glycerol-3-phosphate transport system substrate-binding protein